MKNILTGIGAFVVLLVLVIFVSIGDKIVKVVDLDPGALPAYVKMFDTVLETGDAAKSMILEYEVNEDVSNDDVAVSINTLLGEYNMRLTGDMKMFTKEEALPEEIKHARIFSLCNLTIAKKFLNYSHEFGGFMPCRITMIELGNGKRFLYTMDLTLMILGGNPLSPEMLKLATSVKMAMEGISLRASQGEL